MSTPGYAPNSQTATPHGTIWRNGITQQESVTQHFDKRHTKHANTRTPKKKKFYDWIGFISLIVATVF